jgi:hypothetical protein
MIFQHLLDARYTRLERHTRDDPAYKFHTNILRTCRAIQAEAEQLLDKRNTFVTATHILDMTDAHNLMQELQLWVPLVTWNYTIVEGRQLRCARPMKHNSLQVYFAYSSGGLPGSENPTDPRTPLQARTYVFLAADLESYCSVLSARMEEITGPTFYLSESGPPAGDQTLRSDGRPRPPAELGIIPRSTIHKDVKSRMDSLMTPFLGVIAPSLRVSITLEHAGHSEVFNPGVLEKVRRHVGPSLACEVAVEWASFERFEARKTIADSTALGGELNLALAMYENILDSVSEFDRNQLHTPIPPARWQPLYAVRLIEADLRMTKAHIHYKLRDRAAFKENTIVDSEILNCYRDIHCDFTQQPETVRWLTYLITMAHLDGDVVDMPLRCVDLRRTSDFARKSGHIVGWFDLKTLSRISEDHRTTINGVLMERGLPLAPFT